MREVSGASLTVPRADDRSMNAGFAAGVEMASRRDRLPDGVFAVNEMVGLGVVRGLTSFGIDVPRDVAVIGFDGDEIAAVSAIPLSTISAPGEAIGETAYDLLLSELGEPVLTFGSRQQIVDPELVVRASTVEDAGGTTTLDPPRPLGPLDAGRPNPWRRRRPDILRSGRAGIPTTYATVGEAFLSRFALGRPGRFRPVRTRRPRMSCGGAPLSIVKEDIHGRERPDRRGGRGASPCSRR
ncbi:substrate-binding domain-containing protein [Kineosporia sp. J2-2]|uniref:Substrate-binding domain-containing protein n=1 Tax=Kineosporia corallincola TaxID=2835133 RepID=A0ABS5TCS3_9ACTN|nr:substrate-binding domain-containing protein [Kineosporia corallincola]